MKTDFFLKIYLCTSSGQSDVTCRSALCPFRLRWSVGLCCRRPMTSVMPSLCVGWPGSPRQQRSVTQPFDHFTSISLLFLFPQWKPHQWLIRKAEQITNAKVTKNFLCVRSVFSGSCRHEGPPVRARVLGSCEQPVWRSAHTGEIRSNTCPCLPSVNEPFTLHFGLFRMKLHRNTVRAVV